MDRQLLPYLIQTAIPLALAMAAIAALLLLIRDHRNISAIRRRMAEINAGGPELTAIVGGRARRQGGWPWHRTTSREGKPARAA